MGVSALPSLFLPGIISLSLRGSYFLFLYSLEFSFTHWYFSQLTIPYVEFSLFQLLDWFLSLDWNDTASFTFLVNFSSQVGGRDVSRTNWHVGQMGPSIVENSFPRILTERCGWQKWLVALYEILQVQKKKKRRKSSLEYFPKENGAD